MNNLSGATLEALLSKELRKVLLTKDRLQIEFVGLKPKNAWMVCDDLWPERICFSMKFFEFAETRTPSVIIQKFAKNYNEVMYSPALGEPVNDWTNTGSTDLDRKFLKLEFPLDFNCEPEECKDTFIEYFITNNIDVFLWNADGMLLLGTCKINLKDLLRNGERCIRSKFPIFDTLKEEMGDLVLNLEISGKTIEGANYSKSSKTKLYSKPIVAENSLDKYRTFSRTMALSSIVGMDSIKAIPRLVCYPGHLLIYPIYFSNRNGFRSSYRFIIREETWVQLVTDPNEWKYYCYKRWYDQPSDWELITSDCTFSLDPKESMTLLIKCFTLSIIPTKRPIELNIVNEKTNKTEYFQEYCLVIKEPSINGCFIFNKPENTEVEIIITPDEHQHDLRLARYSYSSNTNVKVSVDSNQRIVLSCVTPISPSDLECYLYFYQDLFCYELVSVFKVRIRAYQYAEISEVAGKRLECEIPFQSQELNTKVNAISSNPRILKVSNEDFDTESGLLPISANFFKFGTSTVFLHIFGNSTLASKLLNRYMINLHSSVPAITTKYELSASKSELTRSFFVYTNGSPFTKIAEFTSSAPETLETRGGAVEVPPGESVDIEVFIRYQNRGKQQYAVVFVFDTITENTEALSFVINFI